MVISTTMLVLLCQIVIAAGNQSWDFAQPICSEHVELSRLVLS
jgi:hypothetical protein